MFNLPDSVSRNVQWFSSVSQELIYADTATQLQACICLAICDEVNHGETGRSQAQLLELLAALGEKDPSEFWKGNLENALICGLIQQKHMGRLSPNFATLIERVDQDLGQMSAEQAPLRYRTAFLYLHRYGRRSYAEAPLMNWPDDIFDLIMSDESELSTLCTQIGLATDFGRREVEAPEALIWVLQACALNAWKTYDVELAALLTRTLVYLGERISLGLRSAREFILQNQCTDGSFGFLGKEIFESQMRGTTFAGLKLQVPFALHCLWTLVETGEGLYSLRHQIGLASLPGSTLSQPMAANYQ